MPYSIAAKPPKLGLIFLNTIKLTASLFLIKKSNYNLAVQGPNAICALHHRNTQAGRLASVRTGVNNTANLKIPPYEIFDLTTHGFGPHLQAKQ